MATNTPSSAPTPRTDAERQLLRLLREEQEQVRPKFARKLLKEMGETREAATAVLASVEREPEKRVSFAEAVKQLEGSLDLEAARTDAVKSHGRWSLVDAVIAMQGKKLAELQKTAKKSGDPKRIAHIKKLKQQRVKNAADYGALFDEATVSETDLREVRESLERGKKVLPIFDAGGMTPNELFAVLFTEGGVPHNTDSYGFKNLAGLRRIDPKNIPDLQNLAGKSYKDQLAAFEVAYKEADPFEPTGPRVTFTPDERGVTRISTSATQDMQALAGGEMAFVDPNADMIRFRTQMDAGLRKIAGRRGNLDGMDNAAYRAFLDKVFADKTIDEYMPNRGKVTRYPNYAFENGGIPGLFFDPNSREVNVNDSDPNFATDNLRSRISFG